jgi:GH15 family glucan-1,4-alpha-glucosidase
VSREGVVCALRGRRHPGRRHPAATEPLQDYALIGNCQTAALVAADGAIDWLCLPHFGAPAVFARILDAETGGYLALTEPDLVTSAMPAGQSYEDESAVLQTVVTLQTGQLRIVDCMPLGRADNAIVRQITALAGPCRFAVRVRATPDFARATQRSTLSREGALAASSVGILVVALVGEGTGGFHPAEDATDQLVSQQALAAGETLTLVVGWANHPYEASQMRARFQRDWAPVVEETRAFWRGWSAGAASRALAGATDPAPHHLRLRPLDGARFGHLGNSLQATALHLFAGDVLGRAGPRVGAGRALWLGC